MSPDEHSSDVIGSDPDTNELARYARQIRYAPFGAEGQEKLLQSTAVIVGCGALGSVHANTLVRAGVGCVKIIDRDFLELNNLQRQVLFDERDIAEALPKSVAAARKLAHINSSVRVEAIVRDVDWKSIAELCGQCDVILDGTDNFETRFLLNDFSLESGIPWIYGGCVGCEGQTMTIVPKQTPCLRCLMSDGPPPPGTTPTCDTAGILGPIVNVVASMQCNEALKILSGNMDQLSPHLTVIDLWENRQHQMSLRGLRERANCPACFQSERIWLRGSHAGQTAILCGRGAVQVSPSRRVPVDLTQLGERLSRSGRVEQNEFLVKFHIDGHVITVFEDGRAIVSGTDNIVLAKTLLAKWVGA